MQANKKIGLLALALLITGSIDSIRNLPTVAMFGPKLIFFAIMGALFFLIPVALVSAELVTAKGLQGGIYAWVKKALGERIGFVAIWLQWINTMVWYPTMLSFIAGTLAYLINPALAQNKGFLVAIILSVFWLITWVNLRGIKTSAMVASVCAVFGMMIPMALVIVLGFVWLVKGLPLQTHINAQTILPNYSNAQSWISLTAIIASFLGMELATVHVKDVDKPNKSFPKSLLFSVFFILGTMILGSLVIAWVLPAHQIHLVDGVMQVFASFFHVYHLSWMLPVLAVTLFVGSVGGMINWVISPARGLLHAAEDHFLPKFFSKTNRHGVASNLLLIQAALVSFMCLAFLLMPSVNGSYWLLTDLSTQLYVMMYILLFVAALALKFGNHTIESSFQIFGGKVGMGVVCSMGLLGCTVTLAVGFLPPGDINVGSHLHYVITFAAGLFIMLLPVLVFYRFQRNRCHALPMV